MNAIETAQAEVADIKKSINYTELEMTKHQGLDNADIVENLESELDELEYRLGQAEVDLKSLTNNINTHTKMKSHNIMADIVHIERDTTDVFNIETANGKWRVAFRDDHTLSSMRAQSIDRANGQHGIIVTPFAVTNPRVLEVAHNLNVGAAAIISL